MFSLSCCDKYPAKRMPKGSAILRSATVSCRRSAETRPSHSNAKSASIAAHVSTARACLRSRSHGQLTLGSIAQSSLLFSLFAIQPFRLLGQAEAHKKSLLVVALIQCEMRPGAAARGGPVRSIATYGRNLPTGSLGIYSEGRPRRSLRREISRRHSKGGNGRRTGSAMIARSFRRDEIAWLGSRGQIRSAGAA